MEVPLPNFQSLEERVKQLSEEISRVRRESPDGQESSISISVGKREQIEKRIRNILEMLEQF